MDKVFLAVNTLVQLNVAKSIRHITQNQITFIQEKEGMNRADPKILRNLSITSCRDP